MPTSTVSLTSAASRKMKSASGAIAGQPAPAPRSYVLLFFGPFSGTPSRKAGSITSPWATSSIPRSPSNPLFPSTLMKYACSLSRPMTASVFTEKTLILLMRYAGLSIQDAVTCSRDHISDETLILRRAKTDELVIVHLPDPVIESLRSITLNGSPYFFWSGESKPVTATKFWRRRLNAVARKAGVANFHPHHLRHTFAVELLMKNVPIEDVSTLLGHSSISTTERHYAAWNKARLNRLIHIVQKANSTDPLLQELSNRSQKS